MFRWQKYGNIIAMLRWSKKCNEHVLFCRSGSLLRCPIRLTKHWPGLTAWLLNGSNQHFKHTCSSIPKVCHHFISFLPPAKPMNWAPRAGFTIWLHKSKWAKIWRGGLNYSRWPSRKYHAVTQSIALVGLDLSTMTETACQRSQPAMQQQSQRSNLCIAAPKITMM